MTTMHGVPFEKYSTIRFGLIGTGSRGRMLLHEVLGCEGVEVIALADASQDSIDQACSMIEKADKPHPHTYAGADAWQKLLEEDLDIVYVATPWDTHTRIAVAVMQSGKHVGVEVPAAITLEECWQLVDTSEQTRRHCVMLENCCYDYWEMIVMRMVEAGLLGTITHAECAYIHDLREMLFSGESEGLWRRDPHITRDSNHYPTHGLGPVAQILKIGSGDAFDYMVSMSSLPASLAEYRDTVLPADDPKRQEIYRAGDMNTSLIRTKMGRTIVLQHSVVSPRPYDRNFMISGTKGTFRAYPPRLYIDGLSQHEEWLSLEAIQQEWEHPIWQEFGEQARQSGGHGGMDFIMNYRLMQLLHEGLVPDSDVYDAAEWSAPGPLSEQSILEHSAVAKFPDFRR